MKKNDVDPVVVKAREIFAASGKTLDEIGVKMGFTGDVARKSVWQFLNKTNDPKIKTLRKFAKAMGIELKELLD